MNDDLTNSVCYRLFGNVGKCTCEPDGIFRNKYGILQPRCKTSGSCTQRS
jgi:hypothetical protein